jgi:2'-5' RNA ligase
VRTALIIAVPEAEPVVRKWRMRYDNAGLGVPAHVTLLFPFVPADQVDDALHSELESLFGSRPRFSFSLPRVARSPDAAWLRPEPDQGFRDLTRLIFDRYPDYPPYGGIHDEVMPHVTVAVGDSSIQEEVEAALTPCLPISAVARDVTLLVEGALGHWQAERRFLLAP